MLTKNYYGLIAGVMHLDYYYVTLFNGSQGGNRLSSAGANIYPSLGFKNIGKALTSNAGEGVLFGDGNTTPTYDDYYLSGNIVTGFKSTSNVTSETDENGGVTLTSVFTITNNGSEDITIKEVCYFGYYGSGATQRCMLDRTVLDSPVTIPTGGVGQVTYSITINIPISTEPTT